MRNKNSLTSLIAGLLIFIFVYTALNKLMQPVDLIIVLTKSGISVSNATFISILIPAVETIVALLLLSERVRLYGFAASFALMAAFTCYILYMMLSMPALPCPCGGVISRMSWTEHLVFNSAIMLFATTAFTLEKKRLKSLLQ